MCMENIKDSQWNEVLQEIAGDLLTSFEVCAEWPDYSSFCDLCDDHSANPTQSLYGRCINLARLQWEAIKLETKKELSCAE